MVSPAVARLAQLRPRRRPDGGGAWRRAEDQAEAHRPPGRRALRALLLSACSSATRTTASPADDRHIVAIAPTNGLYRFHQALRGVIHNFPLRWAAWLMRAVVSLSVRGVQPATDKQVPQAGRAALQPGDFRDRLTRYIFVSDDPSTTAWAAGLHPGQGRGLRSRRQEARTRHPRGRSETFPRQRLDRRRRSQGRPRRGRGALARRAARARGASHRRRRFFRCRTRARSGAPARQADPNLSPKPEHIAAE